MTDELPSLLSPAETAAVEAMQAYAAAISMDFNDAMARLNEALKMSGVQAAKAAADIRAFGRISGRWLARALREEGDVLHRPDGRERGTGRRHRGTTAWHLRRRTSRW